MNKLLEYYSLAVSYYDTVNDEDSTLFYEHKIKQALKAAAKTRSEKNLSTTPQPKNQKKVAQMKLELHTIKKDSKLLPLIHRFISTYLVIPI